MILVALGANLPGPFGSPEETLAEALRVMKRGGVKIVSVSRIWITEPVPVSDQPWFRNAVAVVETGQKPAEFLKFLKHIELELGRTPGARNAPRVLDLDLLAYGDAVLVDGDLVLPHPRMHERGFVLWPLREVAPEWVHPGLGKTVAEMAGALPEGPVAAPQPYELQAS